MADFARIKEQDLWINLDYVVRIEPGVDETESTAVVFADGTSFSISNADGKRLFSRLRPARKKKKKKKKKAAPAAAAPEDAAPTPDEAAEGAAPSGESGF